MKPRKDLILFLSWFILGSAALYLNYMPRVIPVPLNKPFSAFPLEINGWKGVDKNKSYYPSSAIGADDTLVRDYTNASGDRVELCFDYFNDTKDGKTPYPPQTSWVTGGWLFTDLGEDRLVLGGEKATVVIFKKILAARPGNKTLLLYLYKMNGRYTPDFTTFRMAGSMDSILKRKNSALSVQLSSRVEGGGVDREAVRLKDFLSEALTIAEKEFLPQ